MEALAPARWRRGEGDGGGTPGEKRAAEPSRRPRAAVSTTPCASREAGEHGCGRGRHRASTSAAPWDARCANPGGGILLRRAGAPRAAGSRTFFLE
uniref:Uncharacterized protein n=1 Tax=Oryza meridionalis TaxID=40149 RepID=A0A0E0DSP2_9ORYZ